jgi:hypothetical protein
MTVAVSGAEAGPAPMRIATLGYVTWHVATASVLALVSAQLVPLTTAPPTAAAMLDVLSVRRPMMTCASIEGKRVGAITLTGILKLSMVRIRV